MINYVPILLSSNESVYIPINLIIMNFVFDAYINFTINNFIITCLQVLAESRGGTQEFELRSIKFKKYI